MGNMRVYLLQADRFNPRPLRREERRPTCSTSSDGFNPRPPPERGATLRFVDGELHEFQSTPPSGERSDRLSTATRSMLERFQSTPPSEREERPCSEHVAKVRLFQSTPPSGERSDAARVRAQSELVSIHAPLRREERPASAEPHQLVSIHAPLRREERPHRSQRGVNPSGAGSAVSIHAPLRREERRRPIAVDSCRALRFQSTPPSGERSDRWVIRS